MHKIYLSYIFAYTILFFSNCRVHNRAANNIIEYHVFDSLEKELAYACSYTRHHDSAAFIMIDPSYRPIGSDDTTEYMYRFSVFYGKPKGWKIDSIMRQTTRKIIIDGKLYPVYFSHVDDNFTQRLLRNQKFNFDDEVFISYYQKEICIVNMRQQKIWKTIRKTDYWQDTL